MNEFTERNKMKRYTITVYDKNEKVTMKCNTNLYRKIAKEIKQEVMNGKSEEYAYIKVYDNLLHRYLTMFEIFNYFNDKFVIPV